MLLQIFFLVLLADTVFSEDKNGVSPNTVSLPKGPGSIEGLGESFQPMLNTGTARYSVKMKLPAGVNGHTPAVSLSYDSGHGDSPLGIGWSFEPGSVSRQADKGIPRYVDGANGLDDDSDGEVDEPDEVDRFIGTEDEELVQLSDGTFRARIEGTFIRYRRVDQHWEAYLKDGTKFEFGLTAQARITDASGTKIFRWLLEKSTDTRGNVIAFYYTGFSGSNNQNFLKEIRYGAGAGPWSTYYFVYCAYEFKPDWRTDYRSGFLVKTAQRLKQIDIGIQGQQPAQCAAGDWNRDGMQDYLIRSYHLSYDPVHTLNSFLTKVTLFGSDNTSYLPPLSFAYSSFDPELTLSAAGGLINSSNAPGSVMDNQLVDFIDLNRDGLPDILKTDFYGGQHTCYVNLGVNDKHEVEWDDGRGVTSPDGLAPLLHLKDKEVHLADMDGDGLSDLVQTTYPDEVFYYPNQGNGFWGERKSMSIQDTAPPAPFTNTDVKTADLDFDKRIDVVRSTENGYSLWFNQEGGKYSKEVRTAGANWEGLVIKFSYAGVQLADMNGDRLEDVCWIRPTQVIYCASRGHGSFAPSVSIPIPDMVLTDGSNSQVSRAQLKDINGDGLSDLVVERAQANELWYWLNLGTDAFSGRHVITDMPTIFGANTVTRWADINGNGTTDLVYADSTAASPLTALDIGELAGGSAHANLLMGIDNGLGVYTGITYKSSTEHYRQARLEEKPWAVTIPFPVSVIDAVKVTTGLDLDFVPGSDTYTKSYRYRDGFYEDRQKAFRGFAEVTVTEPGDATSPTRVSTHDFFTGGPDGVDNDNDGKIDEITGDWYREEDALKGMVRSVSVAAETWFLFSEEKNDWLVKNIAVSTDDIEVRLALNQKTEKLIYEGTQTPETIRTTFAYDDLNNVTEKKEYGALSITGDEAFTYTEYINYTTNWLIGIPKRSYLTDANGTMLSEVKSYYDGADFTGLSLGQVTRGELTRQEGLVSGSTYVNLIRNAYDSFGNIKAIMDARGNQRLISYDSFLHLFPIGETIQVGGGKPDLIVTAEYNLGLGVPTSSLDFNSNQSTFAYDCFGRLTSLIKPGDTAAYPTINFSYTMTDPAKGLIYSYDAAGALNLENGAAAPSSVKTRAREVSGQAGTFDTVQYVDGMGRKLAQVTDAAQGYTVNGSVLFNNMGTARFSYLPYGAQTAAYARPAQANAAVETRYDAAGRAILSINPPDAQNVITNASTTYLPLAKTVIDENGKTKTFLSDGLERLIEVHELNTGQTYTTKYLYDAPGNLTQITDAQNNIKTMAYDGLKRRTLLNDPDRGRMEYSYDDAGNLIKTKDNKGQIIQYTYDGANRMLTEDYLDAAALTPDVAYHYDTQAPDYATAANLKGKLAWVEDLSGAQFFSCDARGNPIWSVKRIRDGSKTTDYKTAMEYDALGRVTSVTYPDNEKISYRYNKGSQLEAIPGVVEEVAYHPDGKLQSIIYANSLKTAYTYDPRNRLTSLVTDFAAPIGSPIQSLGYSFDGVSNITAITDNRALAAGSPKNGTQAFIYDDLYRLTHAEGQGYGRISFQYDKIGNMTYQSSPASPDPKHINDPLVNLGTITNGGTKGTSGRSVKLPGDQPGPHAVTATQSGLSYAYDDNGNMIQHIGDTYTWDFKDRLIRTITANTTADYVYDYAGDRVIKKSQTGTNQDVAYYINEAYEVRDGVTEKYVFAGDRRVARISVRQDSGNSQPLSFHQGWNFFSLDVEPTNPAIAAVFSPLSGITYEVWQFDATTQTYKGYVPAQGITDLKDIHARIGYSIKVSAAAYMTISGSRSTAGNSLTQGWNLIGCPVDSPMPAAAALSSIAGKYSEVWEYEGTDAGWQGYLPTLPTYLSSLDTMRPGSAYWIKMNQAAQLTYQEQKRQINFFHPDHLGSSNTVTDVYGAVVESTEFYPYGRPRYEEHNNFNSSYKYTGKELDKESGLMYYGARYYDSVVGRFISVDPMNSHYIYCSNNPFNYVDPNGLEERPKTPSLLWQAKMIREAGIEAWKKESTANSQLEKNLKRLEVSMRILRASTSKIYDITYESTKWLDKDFQAKKANEAVRKMIADTLRKSSAGSPGFDKDEVRTANLIVLSDIRDQAVKDLEIIYKDIAQNLADIQYYKNEKERLLEAASDRFAYLRLIKKVYPNRAARMGLFREDDPSMPLEYEPFFEEPPTETEETVGSNPEEGKTSNGKSGE